MVCIKYIIYIHMYNNSKTNGQMVKHTLVHPQTVGGVGVRWGTPLQHGRHTQLVVPVQVKYYCSALIGRKAEGQVHTPHYIN